MNEIMYKATSQGGIITTAELPNQSDYQKIVRAKKRGELGVWCYECGNVGLHHSYDGYGT